MSEDTTTSSGQDTGPVAYRNRNTGDVHVSAGASADLEARPNWYRVPLSEAPTAAVAAAARAAVEQATIHDASHHRAAGGVTEVRPDGPAVATAAHTNPGGDHSGTGILSRPGMAAATSGVTVAELAARADAEREGPAVPVLSRPDTPAPVVDQPVDDPAASGQEPAGVTPAVDQGDGAGDDAVSDDTAPTQGEDGEASTDAPAVDAGPVKAAPAKATSRKTTK